MDSLSIWRRVIQDHFLSHDLLAQMEKMRPWVALSYMTVMRSAQPGPHTRVTAQKDVSPQRSLTSDLWPHNQEGGRGHLWVHKFMVTPNYGYLDYNPSEESSFSTFYCWIVFMWTKCLFQNSSEFWGKNLLKQISVGQNWPRVRNDCIYFSEYFDLF